MSCSSQSQARPDEDGGKKKKGKLRAPAWCDRILWRTATKTPFDLSPGNYGSIEQLDYYSVKLPISDHMPVGAFFRLCVRSIDKQRRRDKQSQIYQQVQICLYYNCILHTFLGS